MTILHVADEAQWGLGDDPYGPEGWEAEGFIHCCIDAQLDGVLARHFAGRTDLVILEIDAGLLDSPVVWEDVFWEDAFWEDTDGQGEKFPHVYGPISRAAVVATRSVDPAPGPLD